MAQKRTILGRIKQEDKFAWKAKRDGYRARSAYKLQDIVKKFFLIEPGDKVVDLGAAPGSWAQSAIQIAGEEGMIIAVDIVEIKPFEQKNIHIMKADLEGGPEEIDQLIGDINHLTRGQVDVVLSDMAPKTTGQTDVDLHRSFLISMHALSLAKRILRDGGNFLVKTYQSADTPKLVEQMKSSFKRVQLVRPAATKKRSNEAYIVAIGFKRKL